MRARRKLVGAEDDGAQIVELVDFSGGERAIVDADVAFARPPS